MKESEYVGGTDGVSKLWFTNEPIVRCRDCRKMRFNSIYRCHICGAFCSSIPDGDLDGFCAWGERKESDESN